MPIAQANGIETYYEEEGEGTPVLFIHGGFGGAESALFWRQASFKGVLPLDRFRTITYDRRGGGKSTFVQKHYTLADLARDARELLRHLGIARAIIVGDSLGGMVALRFGLDYPDAAQSLLLAETGSHIFNVRPWVKGLMLASRVLPVRPFFPLLRHRVLEPEFFDPLGPLTADEIADRRRRHEEYKGRLRALHDDELFHYAVGVMRNYAVFANIDLKKEIGRLSMPVDIMHGTADRVVRFETGASLTQYLPHAEFHALPDLGHGLFYYPEGRELARQIIEKQAAMLSPVPVGAAD